MKFDKYNRNVTLLCPTCGGTLFQFDGESEDSITSAKCIGCNREFSKQELIDMNAENVGEHADEMKKEIAADFGKELKRRLQQAFKGSKYIKVR